MRLANFALSLFVILAVVPIAQAFSSAPIPQGAHTFAPAQVPSSTTKSYNDWKNEKVQFAKIQLQLTQTQLASAKTKKASNYDPKQIQALEARVNQNEWAIEAAEDLTATDYLVLYLSSQNSPDKFKEAAAKMSGEETAKVLESYLQTISAQQAEKNRATKLPRHSEESAQ